MDEVLAKAEKYINDEEVLISKKGISSTHKEKSRTDKQRERSPKRQRDREIENGPRRDEGVSETTWDHLSPSYDNGIHLGSSPP